MTTALIPGLLMLVSALSAKLHANPSHAVMYAVAKSIAEDPVPVLGSVAEDVAVTVFWANMESGMQENPRAFSWDAKSGLANGVWQIHGAAGTASPLVQARAWRKQLRGGAKVCPEQALAPLSGGCTQAKKLADRRLVRAHDVLWDVLGLQD